MKPRKPTSRRDISELLNEWEYQEEKDTRCNIRRLRLPGNREVLQVRLPLGIEQYELHGRPDGFRPEGFDSWLDLYMHQSKVFGREFALDETGCKRLTSEGLLYYHRYLLFFQIQEFELCIRDTTRNLRLLKFMGDFAATAEQAEFLEQYRPYILRMQVMARALLRVKDRGDIRGALRILRDGSSRIAELPDLPGNDIFEFERARSLESIQELLGQLEEQVPLSPEQALRKELKAAIREEDYERAAELRDQLRDLRGCR